ncbi:MAG: response regulator transcription factor [Hydrococcus sp. RU_2_2]|nr:response regulator transcription factor [Hydrococcus sp. RU_2_2]NJP21322.1 response regulator transcription factor [Hydrococcus sp. CRU_1_1]
MNKLRILLVEDDELFRLGMCVRLQKEPGLEVVAEAIDGESAVELTNQYLPDVVVLDVGIPGIGGVEACRQIKQHHPKVPILILTSHSQKLLIERLISAGASGYCLKGIESDSLILALRSVAAGASWWDATVTAEIRAAVAYHTAIPIPKADLSNPLTHRELEILALIAAGKTNQEIAEHLHIATGTVRVHVHAILQKLDLRDRTSAAIWAHQQGIMNYEQDLRTQ